MAHSLPPAAQTVYDQVQARIAAREEAEKQHTLALKPWLVSQPWTKTWKEYVTLDHPSKWFVDVELRVWTEMSKSEQLQFVRGLEPATVAHA
jgi:hypothetical protein